MIAAYFLIAFASSAAPTPICRRFALRFGYVANPRGNRWHRQPTVLLGGLAMGGALFAGAAVAGLLH